MAKITQECIASARQALSLFTDEELHEYATRVLRKADKENISVNDAIKAIGDEKIQELFNRNSITARNIEKFQKIAKDIKNKITDMAALYVRRHKGLGRSVEEAQRDEQRKLNDVLFSEMSQEELSYLKDDNNRTEILSALDEKEVSPIAKRIAEHIKRYKEYSNAEMVSSDALPIQNIKRNRFLGNHHNQAKILKNGRNAIKAAIDKAKYSVGDSKIAWRTEIKKHLD